MTKEELIAKLQDLDTGDEEKDHIAADRLLLDYINDYEVTVAYCAIPKWYS